jgi:MoxR-like ATPase
MFYWKMCRELGKTTAIRALAKLLGLQMSRIQCTSDLLPSDILSVKSL